jgi:site-specific DNA recombinase
VPYLRCQPNRGGRACVGIAMDPTDDHVREELFDELDKPEFLEAIDGDDHATRRDELTAALTALDGERTELAQEWGAGGLKMTEWREARAGLDQREQRLRAELAAIPAPRRKIHIDDARAAWPDMTLDEKREFLRIFIEKVTVNRAVAGARSSVGNRVEIVWRMA